MKYQLNIRANGGYSADQVKGLTVGDLKALLDEMDDDDEIITYDSTNAYGAAYGTISGTYDESDAEEDE